MIDRYPDVVSPYTFEKHLLNTCDGSKRLLPIPARDGLQNQLFTLPVFFLVKNHTAFLA